MLSGGIFCIFYFAKKDSNAKIVTTIFPIYDICREIMGSSDDILLLEDNGVDLHSYQPTAQDITAISKSELFIFIGGESDDWVGDVIRSANNVNLKTLSLIEEIEKLEENHDGIIQEEEHEHEHEEGEEHSEYDEHIWLSIKNAIQITKSITSSLSLVYPEKAEIFKINSEEYINKLLALDLEYTEYCANKEKTLVIADRFPFLYLVNDYNIKYCAAFSGCSAETEASTETIATLISKVNELECDYILVLETSDQSIARSIIADKSCRTGVEILVINSCQSVSSNKIDSTSYLDIMKNNLENFKKALSL